MAQKVKEARLAAELSQLELAIKLGMTQDNYNKLETGKRGFSPKMLEKLAALPELGLRLDVLRGLKAVEEYGENAILQGIKELYPERYQHLEAESQEKAATRQNQ